MAYSQSTFTGVREHKTDPNTNNDADAGSGHSAGPSATPALATTPLRTAYLRKDQAQFEKILACLQKEDTAKEESEKILDLSFHRRDLRLEKDYVFFDAIKLTELNEEGRPLSDMYGEVLRLRSEASLPTLRKLCESHLALSSQLEYDNSHIHGALERNIMSPNASAATKLYSYQTNTSLWKEVATIAHIILEKAENQALYAKELENSFKRKPAKTKKEQNAKNNSLEARKIITQHLRCVANMLFKVYRMCLALSKPEALNSNLNVLIHNILIKNRDLLRIERKSLKQNTHSGSIRGTSTVHKLKKLGFDLTERLKDMPFLDDFKTKNSLPLYGEYELDTPTVMPEKLTTASSSINRYNFFVYLDRILKLVTNPSKLKEKLEELSTYTPEIINLLGDQVSLISAYDFFYFIPPMLTPKLLDILLDSNKCRTKFFQGVSASKLDLPALNFPRAEIYGHILRYIALAKEGDTKQIFLDTFNNHLIKYTHIFERPRYKNTIAITRLAYDIYIAPGKRIETTTQADRAQELSNVYIPNYYSTPEPFVDLLHHDKTPGAKFLKRDYRIRALSGHLFISDLNERRCYQAICRITCEIQLKANLGREKTTSPEDRQSLYLLSMKIWDLFDLAKNSGLCHKNIGPDVETILFEFIAKELNACRILLRKKRKSPAEHATETPDSFNSSSDLFDNTVEHILRDIPNEFHFDLKKPIPTASNTQIIHTGEIKTFEQLNTLQATKLTSYETAFTAGNKDYDAADKEFSMLILVSSSREAIEWRDRKSQTVSAHAAARKAALEAQTTQRLEQARFATPMRKAAAKDKKTKFKAVEMTEITKH